jgi:hypothetical protein
MFVVTSEAKLVVVFHQLNPRSFSSRYSYESILTPNIVECDLRTQLEDVWHLSYCHEGESALYADRKNFGRSFGLPQLPTNDAYVSSLKVRWRDKAHTAFELASLDETFRSSVQIEEADGTRHTYGKFFGHPSFWANHWSVQGSNIVLIYGEKNMPRHSVLFAPSSSSEDGCWMIGVEYSCVPCAHWCDEGLASFEVTLPSSGKFSTHGFTIDRAKNTYGLLQYNGTYIPSCAGLDISKAIWHVIGSDIAIVVHKKNGEVLSIEFSLPSDAPLFAKMIGKISVQEGTIRGSAGKQLLLTRGRLQAAIDKGNTTDFKYKSVNGKWIIILGDAVNVPMDGPSGIKNITVRADVFTFVDIYGLASECLTGCVNVKKAINMGEFLEVVIYPVARGKDENLLIDRALSLTFTVDTTTEKTLSIGITREPQNVSR